MDLAAIRSDLADLLAELGWNATSFVPGSVDLPAAVVNPPAEVDFATSMRINTASMSVSLLVDTTDAESSQRKLDAAMGTGVVGSVVDALRAATSDAWRSLKVTGAGSFRLTDGTKNYFGADIEFEITA